MTDAPTYGAIDLGAAERAGRRGPPGRRAGRARGAHRFPNRPVALPDGLRWNLLHLFTEALAGLRRAARLRGVGVDTWGVDYALLDERGRVLGLPFHYRDARTDGMIERAFARVPQRELYAATGIQTMPINTVFQLLADEDSPALAAAHAIALVPDLLAFWLSGELANESTCASTTGLLDARTGAWALDLVDRLGLPDAPVRPAGRAGHAARPGCSTTTGSGQSPSTRSPGTTRPRRSSPRRSATSTPRSCRAEPGPCSGSSCPRRCSRTGRARRT